MKWGVEMASVRPLDMMKWFKGVSRCRFVVEGVDRLSVLTTQGLREESRLGGS
jgi:hypothetical protein